MEAVERVLKAAGDRTRLRILALLHQGPLCVCQITEILGLSQPTVSKHLSLLAATGLAEDRKEGRWVFYRLVRRPGPTERGLLRWLKGAFETSPQVQRDRRMLEAKRRYGFRSPCPVTPPVKPRHSP